MFAALRVRWMERHWRTSLDGIYPEGTLRKVFSSIKLLCYNLFIPFALRGIVNAKR